MWDENSFAFSTLSISALCLFCHVTIDDVMSTFRITTRSEARPQTRNTCAAHALEYGKEYSIQKKAEGPCREAKEVPGDRAEEMLGASGARSGGEISRNG